MQQSATMTSITMSVSTHSYGQQQQSSIYNLVLVDRSSRGKTWSYIVCCCWILQIGSILMVWIQHRSRLCGGLIEI
jgi:hypothetical protein